MVESPPATKWDLGSPYKDSQRMRSFEIALHDALLLTEVFLLMVLAFFWVEQYTRTPNLVHVHLIPSLASTGTGDVDCQP